jgi:uncharacterized protein involved in outer membrane biogenesis
MEQSSHTSADSNPQPPAEAAGSSKKPRRWRWIAGGVLLLLILLLLFLPTLAASALGRPLLVAYVNEQLNGRIEIKDCSLGWTSGVRVDGIVIFDATGRQILQSSRVSTDLTALEALRGRCELGRARAEGLDLLLSREPDGSMNWDHLVRTDSTWRAGATMPKARGVVQVDDGSLTFEDRSDSARLPVFLRSIHAGLKLPPDGGVHEVLSATAQLGSAKPGTILLKGSIVPDAKNGLAIEQSLRVAGMDAEAVSRELGPSWVITGQTANSAMFERKPLQSTQVSPDSQPSTRPH